MQAKRIRWNYDFAHFMFFPKFHFHFSTKPIISVGLEWKEGEISRTEPFIYIFTYLHIYIFIQYIFNVLNNIWIIFLALISQRKNHPRNRKWKIDWIDHIKIKSILGSKHNSERYDILKNMKEDQKHLFVINNIMSVNIRSNTHYP